MPGLSRHPADPRIIAGPSTARSASSLRAAVCKLAAYALVLVGAAVVIISIVGARPTSPSMLRMRGLGQPSKLSECAAWDLTKEMGKVRCACDGCGRRRGTQPPTIAGFWHVAFMDNEQSGWLRIVKEQLAAISRSRIGCSSQQINVETIGQHHHLGRLGELGEPFRLHWNGADVTQWEYPTLEKMQAFCGREPEALVWYIHNKGARFETPVPSVEGWRHFLEHYVLQKHAACVSALLEEGYDTCGANLKRRPFPHYAGNFWWARCDYINRLEDVRVAKQHPTGRMYAEQWLLSLPDAKARNFITYAEYDPYKITYRGNTYAFPSLKRFCPAAGAWVAGQDGEQREGIYYVTADAPGKVDYRLDD